MYEYEFIEIAAYDLFTKSSDYRKIVCEKARDGWRFVSAIPKYWSENGKPIYLDLVFEKPVDTKN